MTLRMKSQARMFLKIQGTMILEIYQLPTLNTRGTIILQSLQDLRGLYLDLIVYYFKS